ncbi:DUF4012 domain-containing protein, partial [Candidatus Roizmanbacteria bacterium]|nr:DUF4012 domain-containing protein [Candidatus Roizmanbacteria bacterium]
YLPARKIRAKGEIVLTSAKQLKTIFAQNNIDLLQKKLTEITKQYADFQHEAQGVYWARFIPYVADFKNGVEAGDYMLRAANETIKAVAPYADLIGFKKGETSFVERSADDRLQTAILTLDKVLGKLDVISEDIRQAELRIDAIDANRYPERIGQAAVRAKIGNVKEQFIGLASLFVDAKPLLKNLPAMFGKGQEKTYLLLFQNIYERRATGGFLTAYAIFRVNNGKMTIERSGDIYALDESIAVHPVAPPQILAYHKGVSSFFIRDSNLSPDFPKSVALFNSLYLKSGARVKYDGIMAIDAKILVDMLKIFGDTEADGIVFSAKTDKRCDCPQVIYTLFDLVDRPVDYVKENRKGVLGDLMYQLFYKAIGFSPSKYWGTLAQQMFLNLQEKHILLYFVDPNLEEAAQKMNFAGRIREYPGDYLHVNNVNFAGAKSNLFVSESFISKTTITKDKVTRNLKIEYRNPYPHSDCNLERGGLCLNATLRNWLRVYVPKGAKLLDFKGSSKPVKTYDDLDKTVFEGYLEVTPLGRAEIDIVYELPAAISIKPYRLLVQKQPGTDTQKLKVTVDGRTLYNGVLDIDHELK